MTIYAQLDDENKINFLIFHEPIDDKKYVKVELPDDHPIVAIGKITYRYVDGEWVEIIPNLLAEVKEAKDRELNEACSNSILAGFEHEVNGVVYWFSYDIEAQGNFRDARDILKDGLVTEVPWTVREGGEAGEYTRIVVNLETMDALTLKIMEHKMNNISRYRDILMPLVKSATTIEEVEAITWLRDTSGTS